MRVTQINELNAKIINFFCAKRRLLIKRVDIYVYTGWVTENVRPRFSPLLFILEKIARTGRLCLRFEGDLSYSDNTLNKYIFRFMFSILIYEGVVTLAIGVSFLWCFYWHQVSSLHTKSTCPSDFSWIK